eukprot:7242588-Lingulodinium_polyedra.AAC.1
MARWPGDWSPGASAPAAPARALRGRGRRAANRSIPFGAAGVKSTLVSSGRPGAWRRARRRSNPSPAHSR